MTLGSTSRTAPARAADSGGILRLARGLPLAALRALCVLCLLGGVVAADAVAQDVKQAGTDVPPPKRTKFVAPVYPPEAQAAGQRGIVILELVVDPRGKVASVNVVRSVPPFDEAALVAVRQWEYEPTRADGQPVSVRLTVPITFALKLPTVSRAAGVPELRIGAAPGLPPQPWSQREPTVQADVTIDADGQVVDALVTAGDSPWAEALLQALRTWRFVGSPGEGPLSLKVTARFIADGQTSRVDLALSEPKRSAAAPSPDAQTADADAAPPPAASPSPAAPASPAATVPALPDAVPASPAPAGPPPSVTSPPAAARPGSVAAASPTTPQAPPVEVIPAPPPPPPPPEGGGGSAVRSIQLGTGVPDLVSGRRPVVPPLARLKTVTGKVLVRFAVDASGSTSAVEAEGADPLREAARQAVASWIFRRTKADRLRLAAEFDYGVEAATATVKLEAEAGG